jgi:hypothetical protein
LDLQILYSIKDKKTSPKYNEFILTIETSWCIINKLSAGKRSKSGFQRARQQKRTFKNLYKKFNSGAALLINIEGCA